MLPLSLPLSLTYLNFIPVLGHPPSANPLFITTPFKSIKMSTHTTPPLAIPPNGLLFAPRPAAHIRSGGQVLYPHQAAKSNPNPGLDPGPPLRPRLSQRRARWRSSRDPTAAAALAPLVTSATFRRGGGPGTYSSHHNMSRWTRGRGFTNGLPVRLHHTVFDTLPTLQRKMGLSRQFKKRHRRWRVELTVNTEKKRRASPVDLTWDAPEGPETRASPLMKKMLNRVTFMS